MYIYINIKAIITTIITIIPYRVKHICTIELCISGNDVEHVKSRELFVRDPTNCPFVSTGSAQKLLLWMKPFSWCNAELFD